jgi:hypothetical protein
MAMLLLLLAAAAPGKERAALQADLDLLATTLDSMLGHFEKTDMADVAQAVMACVAGACTEEEMESDSTLQNSLATSDPPQYLYHAAPAHYFESLHDFGFDICKKGRGATSQAQANTGRTPTSSSPRRPSASAPCANG